MNGIIPSAADQKTPRGSAAILPHKRRILIMPHDFPDPDALASASRDACTARDKKFGIHSQIAFSGDGVARGEQGIVADSAAGGTSSLVPPRPSVCSILVDTAPWSRNMTIPPFARPCWP
jgi:nanoRNase/pAp phosphatase (c-di-AMP/oligoRNAs hydrolase)